MVVPVACSLLGWLDLKLKIALRPVVWGQATAVPMYLAVSVPCAASSRLAMRHSTVMAAHVSSSMGVATRWRTPPQNYLRARTAVACDAFSDEFSDEYEEALARYTALGLFDNLSQAEEVEDDHDDTPEEMAALSQEYLAAAAEERARLDALREQQLVAAAEAEERQRIAQWEEHFVNILRLEQLQATWDEDRASALSELTDRQTYREPERGC